MLSRRIFISFESQGDADRGPTKDIITMMKEFQAENDQREQILAEQSAAALIRDTTTLVNPTTTTSPPPPSESVSTSIGSSDVNTSKQEKIPENPQDLPLSQRSTKKSSTIVPKRSFLERNTKLNGSSSETLRVIRNLIMEFVVFFLPFDCLSRHLDVR